MKYGPINVKNWKNIFIYSSPNYSMFLHKNHLIFNRQSSRMFWQNLVQGTANIYLFRFLKFASCVLLLVFVHVIRLMWTISPDPVQSSCTAEDFRSNDLAQIWCFTENLPKPWPIYVYVQFPFTARIYLTSFLYLSRRNSLFYSLLQYFYIL
jgi:hypothetical protein